MNWPRLFKCLRYLPRLIWMGCILAIVVITLQSSAASEKHQQLSARKLSGAKTENPSEGDGVLFWEALSSSEDNFLVQKTSQEMLQGKTYMNEETRVYENGTEGECQALNGNDILAETEVPEEKLAEEEISVEKEKEILSAYQELYEENNDLAGWLAVDGTVIDYPVMNCIDGEFYLHHNFEKEDSKYGELFIKPGSRQDIDGTNVIIYGHHMGDGSMFGILEKYKSQKFYEEHPVIRFDTLYEQYTYEIVAAFYSQVYKNEADAFKYYEYYGEWTEENFEEFYRNIKEMSRYDTGVEAEYGDSFLTLSTCAYHVENGRFAVVARRVQDEIEP